MILGVFWKFFHPWAYSLTSRHLPVSYRSSTAARFHYNRIKLLCTYGCASVRCYLFILFMHPCLTICLKSIETAEDALSVRGQHAALHRSSPHDAWLCLSLQPSNAQVEWHYLAESLPPSRNKCKETPCAQALVHL